jgi:capsular polysaccharide biosynthesis protein
MLSVGCYALRNVGVTSHSLLVRDGVLLTSGRLSLSRESIVEAATYGALSATARYSRVIDEPVVSLAGPGHLIYGHWIVDFLPKLYVLHRLGFDPHSVKYIIPSNTPQFALEWLHLLGISPRQLIFFDSYKEVVGTANLIVPTLLRTNGRAHPIFRAAIDYLRSLLLAKRETRSTDRPGRRIYLSRGSTGSENRKLLNRERIERFATRAGYEVIRPESLSILDQLTMFGEAETIIGEYGSALHGSLFAPSGAMVCALRASARHPGFLQSGLCQSMEQKISYVFGAADEHDIEQQFTIFEDDFKKALELIDAS